MTGEQFDALMVLIDAMIVSKITDDERDWQRVALLKKDAKELLVNADRKVLGEKE